MSTDYLGAVELLCVTLQWWTHATMLFSKPIEFHSTKSES